MEIERYTLATGETAVSGFARFWKPWAIVLSIMGVNPFLFLVWATGGVTNSIVMVIWSAMLLVLNSRALPQAIKVKGLRLIILAFSVLFYLFFAGWLVIAQIQGLLAE